MPRPQLHPSEIEIKDFEYSLPDDRIARFPLEKRDESKLLIYQKGNLSESVYHQLANHIPAESLLIFNQAKVVHARLYFQKKSGGKIEIFCLEPDSRYPDITAAMAEENEVYWKCLLKGASKWKDDSALFMHTTFLNAEGAAIPIRAKAKKAGREGSSFIIHFSWESGDGDDRSFSQFLELAGKIPIPPYLKREAEKSDDIRYQTIFAKNEGSVAAPTAALHFTPRILKALQSKKIKTDQLTLHVGAGTFIPVKSQKMQGHEMHAEWIEIPLHIIENTLRQLKDNKKIIGVGTTSARTLESAYWIGIQLLRKEWKAEQGIAVSQWYPYQKEEEFSTQEVLEALLAYYQDNNIEKLITRTRLIIAPGYEFKLLDGLITNFHQPHSTLLLMIAALTGDDWRKIYSYALDHNFRFLSYGDGCLLWKNEKKEG